jgi:hypothetical protein
MRPPPGLLVSPVGVRQLTHAPRCELCSQRSVKVVAARPRLLHFRLKWRSFPWADKTPVKRNRTIRLSGGTRSVNRGLELKAMALAGLKGYITNLRACLCSRE